MNCRTIRRILAFSDTLTARSFVLSNQKVRVAIAGLGNCATSLIEGVEYYKNASVDDTVPGLMHVQFGDYHVSDLEFVTAFDVDAKKVGLDIAEAIRASENNTIKLTDVPETGVTVLQIGRASCRERVQITVIAVGLRYSDDDHYKVL